ncbi:type II toxin-antitoxin system VapC family toxin [Sphingomonas oligophenolica]|uniref:Type II toxin-antitoxin system VapC family toxin n=1 Tax=Sphingomonas oligophenolica TaxID=301154 RepID=A0ABU9Y0A6_9SPHN
MPFVADASVAASWLLPDEADPRADAAYALFPDDSAVAPGLWWLEIRNIFLVSERRGRFDGAQTDRALALLAALPISLDHAANEATLMMLARRHKLTACDAAYLELAQRRGISLATLDETLARAARAEGVRLIGEDA